MFCILSIETEKKKYSLVRPSELKPHSIITALSRSNTYALEKEIDSTLTSEERNDYLYNKVVVRYSFM